MEAALLVADEGLFHTQVNNQADGEKTLVTSNWKRCWTLDYSDVFITWNYGPRDCENDHIGWWNPPNCNFKIPMLSYEMFSKLMETVGMPGGITNEHLAPNIIKKSSTEQFNGRYYRLLMAKM